MPVSSMTPEYKSICIHILCMTRTFWLVTQSCLPTVFFRNHSDDDDGIWCGRPSHRQRCTALQHCAAVARQSFLQHVLHWCRKRRHCHSHLPCFTRQRGAFICKLGVCAYVCVCSSMQWVSAKWHGALSLMLDRFLCNAFLKALHHMTLTCQIYCQWVKKICLCEMWHSHGQGQTPDECLSISMSNWSETTGWLLFQQGDECQNIDWVRWWKRNISCCQTLSA